MCVCVCVCECVCMCVSVCVCVNDTCSTGESKTYAGIVTVGLTSVKLGLFLYMN